MREITVKGRPLPIHFGMKAINEFTKRQELDFEQVVTAPETLSNLDTLVALAISGLNEGARLARKDDRYTEDDVWDMFDDDPALIIAVSDAFIECVEPLMGKLGGLSKNSKRPARKPNPPRR